jgi:hypothetical protein
VEFWTSFVEEPWALLRIDIEQLEEAPDGRVLALLTFTGIGRESSVEVTLHYAHLCRFEGGLVTRLDAFSDWDEARQAAGLEG